VRIWPEHLLIPIDLFSDFKKIRKSVSPVGLVDALLL
jgi:hypothetical protein